MTLPGSIDSLALYRPLRMVVTNVTNAAQAVVTTQINHQYSIGDQLRLLVPISYRMTIDNVIQIIAIPTPLTFQCNLNTIGLDPFVIPVPLQTPAQLIPISVSTDNVYDNPPVTPAVFIVQLA